MPSAIHIWQRGLTAFKKFIFCYRVSATPAAFIRLLINTKKFAWSNKRAHTTVHDEPVAYRFSLNNNTRTVYLRTYAGDLQIFYDIFWRCIYNLPAGIFSDAKTIIDIGAHVGMASLFFKLHAPGAIIYCIEADGSNYDMLTKNLQPDIISHTINATHAAINDTDSLVYIEKAEKSYNSRLAGGVTGFPVKGMRMDTFLSENNIQQIDVVKIDIEGAEAFLFNDDTSWLNITRNILIEIHSDDMLQQFNDVVTRHGFTVQARHFGYEYIYHAFK